MYFAVDDKGQRIEAERAKKEDNYHCPICKGKVVLKNGKIKVPHFAHRDSVCMDNWNYDMSEWHRAWQKIFPEENQEIVIKTEIFNTQYEAAARINGFSDKSYDEYIEYKNSVKKEKIELYHRADVCINGYVIEFQHSPISNAEFNERNWFYKECGYKVVWIFDFRDKEIYSTDELYFEDEHGALVRLDDDEIDWNNQHYKWNWASKTFNEYIPQNHKGIYDDGKYTSGDITVYFQLDDGGINRVKWAIPNGKYSSFSRFVTGKDITGRKEFVQLVNMQAL